MASEYERIRLRNIEDNKRILAELGLVNPYKPLPRIIKRSNNYLKRKRDSFDAPSSKRIKIAASATPEASESWTPGTRRRSRRLLGKARVKSLTDAPEIEDAEDVLKEEDDDEEDEDFRPTISKDRPQVYGAIPGVEVGTHWMFRMEANRVGVHRPVIAGIHPGPNGAYSIALSGGYEDDLDYGECFTYTGEGGRDLKGTKANPKNLRTAPQSKHQALSRGNKALVDSVESGLPVRVLRGYKLDSPFAPEDGYRYDGLYKVDKWWYTGGMAGFNVYKFALSRLKDQPPPPWYMNTETGDVTMSNETPVDIDSRRKEDKEKKDNKAAKTKKEAGTDLVQEKMDADDGSNSSASDSHENKDPLKAMSGPVSKDDLTGGKLEDVSLKDLENNEKSSENVDSMVSEEFANNTSKNPDEVSKKSELCELDTSKSTGKRIIENEACENDTGASCGKPSTNDEDLENNTDKSSDGGSGSTDETSTDKTSNICDMNSKETGIKINGSSQNPNSVSCGDQVLGETKSEAATSVLHERSSPKDLMDSSISDKNTESSQAVCNNVLSNDTNSQDSGLGVTQPQTTSEADVGSVKSGDAITITPGKLEVEDENGNIATC